MTNEEIKTLTFEEVEERRAALEVEIKTAEPEVAEAINAEFDQLEERKRILDLEIEEQRKAAEAVANGAGKVIETRKEDKKMTNLEVRGTKEYADAYLKYIKTGKDTECRALLSENVDPGYGDPSVPVPEIVDGFIRTAWESDKLFSRLKKSFIRGNLKVGYEATADDAQVHEEGSGAINEENLVLGIVTMIPKMVKKYITVSDEALGLSSEELIRYIYDEIGYRIIKKVGDLAVAAILSAPWNTTTSGVGVAEVNGAVTTATIIEAISKLGDNARDLVFIASGQTIADVKIAALSAGYAYDPFQGLTVIQRDGMTGAIIGDLAGVQVNLPEGGDIRFKFDDLSMAEEDMVKIAELIYLAATDFENSADTIRAEVTKICEKYPIY